MGAKQSKKRGNRNSVLRQRLLIAGLAAFLVFDVALVAFARVAFGAATSAERFSGAELGELVSGLTEGGRATLEWQAEVASYS